MNALHCDAEGCDYWELVDAEIPVFYTLLCPDESEMHLCSLDCLTSWSAQRSPSKAKLRAIALPSSMGPEPGKRWVDWGKDDKPKPKP